MTSAVLGSQWVVWELVPSSCSVGEDHIETVRISHLPAPCSTPEWGLCHQPRASLAPNNRLCWLTKGFQGNVFAGLSPELCKSFVTRLCGPLIIFITDCKLIFFLEKSCETDSQTPEAPNSTATSIAWLIISNLFLDTVVQALYLFFVEMLNK